MSHWYKKYSDAINSEVFDLDELMKYTMSNLLEIIKITVKKENQKLIFLGSLEISSYLNDIYKKYGKPINKVIPKIDFFLSKVSKSNRGAKAVFVPSLTANSQIIIVVDKYSSTIDEEELELSVEHEMQHFVSFLYEKDHSRNYKMKGNIPDDFVKYFSDKSEIDSHSREMARFFIRNLKFFSLAKIKRGQTIDDIVERLEQLKESKIESSSQLAFRIFQKDNEKGFNIVIPPEVRDKYISRIKQYLNFFYDKMIQEIKNEVNQGI